MVVRSLLERAWIVGLAAEGVLCQRVEIQLLSTRLQGQIGPEIENSP